MIKFSLIKKLASALSISISLYENKDVLADSAKHTTFSPDPAYFYIRPYIHMGRSMCQIATQELLLCGYLEIAGSDHFLCIGPAIPYQFNINQARSIVNDMHLPEHCIQKLLADFHMYPQMSIQSFADLIEFLNAIINPNQQRDLLYITNKRSLISVRESKDLSNSLHASPEIENKLCSMIRFGKPDEIICLNMDPASMNHLEITTVSPSILRSAKNIFIASCAIISRVAVSGGLDYETSLSLSDYYITKVESLNNYNDVITLMLTMEVDYAQRVSVCLHPQSDSAVVNAIYKDIQNHLHEKISASDIAERLSMSQSYLAHLFKKTTEKTLTQYIHEQKIREACYLIEVSDLDFAGLAVKLGFSSQQHFQTVFKKITGITPGAYQQAMISSPQFGRDY